MNVLLVADDEKREASILGDLSREFDRIDVRRVMRAEELAEALSAPHVDVVVVDADSAWADPLSVSRSSKERWRDCAVVVLLAQGRTLVEITQGEQPPSVAFDDYVRLDSQEASRRLRAVARVAVVRAEQRRAEEALRLAETERVRAEAELLRFGRHAAQIASDVEPRTDMLAASLAEIERRFAAIAGGAETSSEIRRAKDALHAAQDAVRKVVLATRSLRALSQDSEPAPTRKPKVLIVDDEPRIGTSIARLLGRTHDVVALTSGVEALRRIEGGERFDAILCDVSMPEISGVDVLDTLRANAPDQADRLVFLTGGAFTDGTDKSLEQTGRPFLQKPCSRAQLEDIIASVGRSSSRPPE